MYRVFAHHGVRHAIEVENCCLFFHAYLDNSRPHPTFHEARHGAFHQLSRVTVALLNKIGQGPADNLLKGRVDEIGKTAVDGADLAVKRERKQNVVEGVD